MSLTNVLVLLRERLSFKFLVILEILETSVLSESSLFFSTPK